jgi:hypothetical protein
MYVAPSRLGDFSLEAWLTPTSSRGVEVPVKRRSVVVTLAATVAVVLVAAGLVGAIGALPADAAVRPTATATTSIGRSVQGRPLTAVRRWVPGTVSKHRIVVIGVIHGNEKAGLGVVTRLRSVPLPAGSEIWLIPTINPDGLRRGVRQNAHGVDLNRNFPELWARTARGTATYAGPRAASEPETRAVIAFLAKVKPTLTVIFHQPLYGVDSYRPKDISVVRSIARTSGLPVRSFTCGGGCHGTLTQWHNRRLPGMAVTVEFGRRTTATQLSRTARAVLEVGLVWTP